MKNMCYNIVEKRKKQTKNVSIFQINRESKSDANVISAAKVVAKSRRDTAKNKKRREAVEMITKDTPTV